MEKSKRIVLAVVLAMQDAKLVLPTKEKVQAIKHQEEPIVSTQAAMKALLPCGFDGIENSRGFVADKSSIHLKAMRKLDDKALAEKYPDISELWNGGIAKPIGNVHHIKLEELKSKPALLAQLNLLYKKRSLAPLKSWKGTIKELEKKIEQQKKMIERDIPAWRVHPAAVAEGAYRSPEEAKYKTGHTTNGKDKALEKLDAKKAKFIEKRLASSVKNVPVTKAATGSFVTLSDIARSQKIEPKIARNKARRYSKEIEKLQLPKQKYKFDPKKASAVAAILTRDSRRK